MKWLRIILILLLTSVASGQIISDHLKFRADNTWDIGTIGALRPRNIFAAGTIDSGKHTITTSTTPGDQLVLVQTASNHTATFNLAPGGAFTFNSSLAGADFQLNPGGGTGNVKLQNTIDLIWNVDGGGDIGASGATRPDNIFTKNNITVGGQVLTASGDATAPGLAFALDPDTGIYLTFPTGPPTPGLLNIATDGVFRASFGLTGMIIGDNFNVLLGGTGKVTSGTGGFVVGTSVLTNNNLSMVDSGINLKATSAGTWTLAHDDGASRLNLENDAGAVNVFRLNTGVTSGGELDVIPGASMHYAIFAAATSGETRELRVYGFRSGDALRSLQIGVGVDAADTASFDGVSDYWLRGNLLIGKGSAGVDYTFTFRGETNDGVITWMEDEDRFDFADAVLVTGFHSAITTKTDTDYTATINDDTILVSTGATTRTINLAAASTLTGKIYHIKKIDSGSGGVILDGNGSETIDSALTAVITAQYESITFQSDGMQWWIL